MELDINYNNIYSAIESLRKDIPLSDSERRDVIAILKSVQGDYIPSSDELKSYNLTKELMEEARSRQDETTWKRLKYYVTVFENKYTKK